MASSSAIFGAKLKDSGFTSCFSPSMRARRCRKHALNKVLAVAAPARSPCSPSITGSVKQAMTMTEKILARASEKTHLEPGENVWVTVDVLITQKTHLEPGENVWVNVDVLMTHDVCGPGDVWNL
ncbi:3-isopropylmalate dehydratase large subunit, chloroplastic-like [Musa acuminata AAA Group]|uniref:3-isopropylmalate dehydratase large subunit, chloroplastic-like n=1 Tax=Musa acuminata AAA Group TaxID=214697 RepID=UPI0031D575B5